MNERKKQVKKELKANIRTITILAISLFLINKGISISTLINFTDNDKIKWTLDLGVYTFVLNFIFSLLIYLYLDNKLYCEVSLLNKKEEFNELTIRDTDPEDIFLKIELKGKCRKLKRRMEICFPHWLDPQVKPRPYLEYIEDENKYLIDLNYFMGSKENVTLKESITFNVLKNSDEKNEELIEASLKVSPFKKLIVGFECKGIRIKLK
ncbi:hypothetical protein NX819_14715 [Bacillus subtilis]|uniref:hypothetical protein n=1 Tax=Bacillus subtilis TaxID=1423 RepID=UPI000C782A60|nr:hypothetical protein [Bacillus subtilis]PLV34946.1 hypothetical protein BSP4_10620 [Bacillus subtilis subsp. subtilis]UVW20650.1 hypothetical protein NX819_14715 [Bacillus subtilis]